jgi:hypothetical protein
MGPNDLHHIFGNPRHNLSRFIERYGSREAAGRAIEDAVDAAFAAGALSPNARGVFEATLNIDGDRIAVRGVIHQGMARVGSAWIMGEP